MPLPIRRLVLFAGVVAFGALSARRAHANRDPSELSVGGGFGAHDAHLSCGPDVRVKHASGGFTYQRLVQGKERDAGEGMLIDFRAGLGTTTITQVNPTCSDANCQSNAATLARNEVDNRHVLMTGQAMAGFDWGSFAVMGGLGFFGLATTDTDHQQFVTRYVPLPAVDVRVGRRRGGWSADFGIGSTPVAGFTRWYALYAVGQYRFKEGGEVGAGLIAIPTGEVDARSGVLFKGAVPITDWMTVGGFGVLNANDQSTLTGFNWTAGGQITVLIEEMD